MLYLVIGQAHTFYIFLLQIMKKKNCHKISVWDPDDAVRRLLSTDFSPYIHTCLLISRVLFFYWLFSINCQNNIKCEYVSDIEIVINFQVTTFIRTQCTQQTTFDRCTRHNWLDPDLCDVVHFHFMCFFFSRNWNSQ